jgi:hypothetical protein
MLTRQSGVRKAAIAAGAALSAAIDLREMAGGILKNDGEDWTAADIVFDVCEKEDGVFTTLKDETGTAVKISGLSTTAAEARKLPDELFAARWVKLRSVGVGTVVSENQTAAQSFSLILKG